LEIDILWKWIYYIIKHWGRNDCQKIKIILPDYVEASIAVMYRGASEEKLAEVRAQCAEQITLNEQEAA